MRRRLFNLAAVVSLALCLATGVLWARSYRSPEPTSWSRGAEATTEFGTRQGYVFVTIHEPLPTSVLNGPGFAYQPIASNPFPGVERVASPYTRTTRIRYGLILALVSAGLVPWIASKLRRGRGKLAGVCPTCGYDLRATPERCPECGTVAEIS